MKKLAIIALAIVVIVGGIMIYLKLPYSPEKAKFHKAMAEKSEKIKANHEKCTKEEIEQLPEPLKKYCEVIGLENFPKYQVANADFKNTDFVFDTASGKVIKMDYDLWLFYGSFHRLAFCSSSMFGIPFEGVDYTTDDKKGGMRGILAKHFEIFDTCDEQGYKAGLISWLAESAVINPSALLSSLITYEEIDDNHVKATVTYNGVSGSGTFAFDEEGLIKEFYSPERQVEEVDGVKTELGWLCTYEDYQEQNGIRVASKIKCIKVFPDGARLVYFAAENYKVEYII